MITWTDSGVVNGWLAKAVWKTELDKTRALLVRLLLAKFAGQVTPEALQAIYDQSAVKKLEAWFDEAVKAGTFGDFEPVLGRLEIAGDPALVGGRGRARE